MRYLAIDYGTRRMGLAASDPSGQWVTPLAVVEITTPQAALNAAAAAAREEGSEILLVGVPLSGDGSEGPAARVVRAWAEQLARQSGLGLVLVDERHSSVEAEQSLVERKRAGEKLTRKGKKRRLDAVVAAQLLQAYLRGAIQPLNKSGK